HRRIPVIGYWALALPWSLVLGLWSFAPASRPDVDRRLRNDAVHEDVVRGDRDFREELAIERQRHERRIRAGVLQQLVVIPLAVTHPGAAAVEGDPGDHHDIQLLRPDLFLREQAQLRLWLEDLVHPDRQLLHIREAEKLQFALVIAPGDDDRLAGGQGGRERVPGTDLGPDVDVEEDRRCRRVVRQGHEARRDDAAGGALVRSGLAVGVGLLADLLFALGDIGGHGPGPPGLQDTLH